VDNRRQIGTDDQTMLSEVHHPSEFTQAHGHCIRFVPMCLLPLLLTACRLAPVAGWLDAHSGAISHQLLAARCPAQGHAIRARPTHATRNTAIARSSPRAPAEDAEARDRRKKALACTVTRFEPLPSEHNIF
jgi:hypothetical protein